MAMTVVAHNIGLAQLSLASFYGTSANSAEPDKTPQDAAFYQVLHCLPK